MIRRLSELLDKLASDPEEVRLISGGILLDPEEFREYEFWDPDQYTRNSIMQSGSYELLLMCWESGQNTPIHNHGGEECWIYMLSGQLHEEIYTRDEKGRFHLSQTMSNDPGSISYMNDGLGWHRIQNKRTTRAVSLHLYSKPITSCQVYNEATGRLEERFPRLNSRAGQLITEVS